MPQGNEYSLFLLPTTDQEVNNIIKQLKDGAPGKDGITSLSLKLVSDFIEKPITRTVNLSFSQGVFPNELKIALVSPLYKEKILCTSVTIDQSHSYQRFQRYLKAHV